MAFTGAKLTTVLAVAGSCCRNGRSSRRAGVGRHARARTGRLLTRIDRSWLYLDDARVADPGAVIGMTSVAYANVGSNPDPTSEPYRAFAANTAQPGALAALGAEVGVLPRVSLEALGQVQLGGEGTGREPGRDRRRALRALSAVVAHRPRDGERGLSARDVVDAESRRGRHWTACQGRRRGQRRVGFVRRRARPRAGAARSHDARGTRLRPGA